MAKPGLQPVTISGTFQGWLDRTNEIVAILQSEAITASVVGDTTGSVLNPVSATLIGSFAANNVSVNDLLRTDSISPKIGSTSILINAQITANTALQTAAIFRSTQGARTTYASSSSNWLVGYENVSTNSFVIDNGIGTTKFRLTTDGNLFLSGNLTAQTMSALTITAQQFNGNANTATQLASSANINGVAFNGSANITLPTVNLTGNQTIEGVKTFSSAVVLSSPGTTASQAVRADRAIETSGGITGGGNLTQNRAISLTGQALALNNITSTGFFTRGSDGSIRTRVISGDNTSISVSNGNGDASFPIISAILANTIESQAGTNTVKLMTSARTLDSINANAVRGYIVFNGATGEVMKSRNLTLVKSGTGNYSIICTASIRDGTPNWGVVVTNVDDGRINIGPVFANDYLQIYNTFISNRSTTGFVVEAKSIYNRYISLGGNDNNDGNVFGITAIDPTYIALVVF